jgi:hypothetical protein
MKKWHIDLIFDDEVKIDKENNIQPDDSYKEALKAIQLLIEHCETLSEIRIKKKK